MAALRPRIFFLVVCFVSAVSGGKGDGRNVPMTLSAVLQSWQLSSWRLLYCHVFLVSAIPQGQGGGNVPMTLSSSILQHRRAFSSGSLIANKQPGYSPRLNILN